MKEGERLNPPIFWSRTTCGKDSCISRYEITVGDITYCEAGICRYSELQATNSTEHEAGNCRYSKLLATNSTE